RRRRLAVVAAVTVVVVGFAGVSIARAPNQCVGQVECDLAAASAGTDPVAGTSDPPPTSSTLVEGGGQTTTQQTAAATTSTSSTTTTTLPVDQRPPVAIGESVMLGAKTQLEAQGFVVDAAESRQGKEVVDVL